MLAEVFASRPAPLRMGHKIGLARMAWTCMVMHGYAWLCMAMHGCMGTQGYAYGVMHDSAECYMVMHGNALLPAARESRGDRRSTSTQDGWEVLPCCVQ